MRLYVGVAAVMTALLLMARPVVAHHSFAADMMSTSP